MEKIIKDLKVADNYECARALDQFHRSVLKPLSDRVAKGNDYLIGDGQVLPEKELKKHQDRHDVLKLQMEALEDFYNTTKTLIMRHENMVNEMAKIYVGIREQILHKEKFPKELMTEQVKLMDEYYQILVKFLFKLEV